MNKTALTILAALSASIALADDFKTIDGKEYKNAKVSRVEPDGIVLVTKSGISKVYFAELPKEVQQQFNYDAEKAAAYSAEQNAAIEQLRKQQEEALRQKQQIARAMRQAQERETAARRDAALQWQEQQRQRQEQQEIQQSQVRAQTEAIAARARAQAAETQDPRNQASQAEIDERMAGMGAENKLHNLETRLSSQRGPLSSSERANYQNDLGNEVHHLGDSSLENRFQNAMRKDDDARQQQDYEYNKHATDKFHEQP